MQNYDRAALRDKNGRNTWKKIVTVKRISKFFNRKWLTNLTDSWKSPERNVYTKSSLAICKVVWR